SIFAPRATSSVSPACVAPNPCVLGELKDWLENQVTLTSLSIGKASAYTLGNWPKLIRFVDDARIPLDNNATERGIRGPVVGRRNHFGSKSRRGTVGRGDAVRRHRDREAPRHRSGRVPLRCDRRRRPRRAALARAVRGEATRHDAVAPRAPTTRT